MALDANIRGVVTGTGAEVNTSNQLQVVLETDAASKPYNVGAVRFFSENDAGSITGTPFLTPPETSGDYRLRVGMDTLLYDHTFSEITLDTSSYRISGATTMTSSLSGGFLTLNAGNATVSGNFISYVTSRYYRVRGTSPLYVEVTGNLTAIPITNQVIEIGLFLPTAGVQPVDGVWFQVTSAGVIGVMAYNGAITQSGVLVPPESLPTANNGTYLLIINQSSVQFWIDDILHGEIAVPAGQATPFLTDSLPLTMMQRNAGLVAAAIQAAIRIGDISITGGDIASNKPWASQMAGMGQMGYQGQAGGTMGTSALLPNATAATVVTGGALSQTVTLSTGLGGQVGINATVPGVDGFVNAFFAPVGSLTQPPRNLTIKGLKISAVNIGAAVAGTASIVQWSLAFGNNGAALNSTAQLSQAEAATLTAATTKAWRRIPLGITSWVVGAGIGSQAPDVTVNFDCPVVVFPGEWVAVVAKFIVGTATASQVIWCTLTYDSHWD
jgi:hypothetical protein